MHVLLIRERGACHLYDVASLVGTFSEEGLRVRCLALSDAGTRVRLASRSGVNLGFRAL